MATSYIDKYDDRKHAFTTDAKDIRGNLFTKAMEQNGRQDLKINTFMMEIMKAEDYHDEVKEQNMRDNDLMYEIVDFVATAAHFHKAIDKTTGADININHAEMAMKQYAPYITGAINTDGPVSLPIGPTNLLSGADNAVRLLTGEYHDDHIRTALYSPGGILASGMGATFEWDRIGLSQTADAAAQNKPRIGDPAAAGAAHDLGAHTLIQPHWKDGVDSRGATDFQWMVATVASRWLALNGTELSGALNAVDTGDHANGTWTSLTGTKIVNATKKLSIANNDGVGVVIPIPDFLDKLLGDGASDGVTTAAGSAVHGLITHILNSMGVMVKNGLAAHRNRKDWDTAKVGEKMQVAGNDVSQGVFMGVQGTPFRDGPDGNTATFKNTIKYLPLSLNKVITQLDNQIPGSDNTLRYAIVTKMKYSIKEFIYATAAALIEMMLHKAEVKPAIDGPGAGDLNTGQMLNELESAAAPGGDHPPRLVMQKRGINVLATYVFGGGAGGGANTDNPYADNVPRDAPTVSAFWKDIGKKFGDRLAVLVKEEINAKFDGQYTTIQSSTISFELWDKVYSHWNDVHDKAKAFYNHIIVFMERDRASNKWREVKNKQYNEIKISDADRKNFRFNLKKSSDDGTHTVFSDDLPHIVADNNFGNIWYTDYTKSRIAVDHSVWPAEERKFFLRDLYHKIYRAIDSPTKQFIEFKRANNTLQLVPTLKSAESIVNGGYFHVHMDNLVRKRLFNVHKAKITIEAEADEEKYIDTFDMIDSQTWFVRDGKYYRIEDGKEVEYGYSSDTTQKSLMATNRCYTTGHTNTGSGCRKYIYDCLLSEKPEDLKICLEQAKFHKFTDLAKVEINKMHPIIAIRTLKQFGFKTKVQQDNIIGARLKKVETVPHWLKRYCSKQLTATALRDLKNKNEHVLHYLNLIVQFVNSNPGILNEGYDGVGTEESNGTIKVPPFVTALGIKMQVPPPSITPWEEFAGYRTTMRHGDPFSRTMSGAVQFPFGYSRSPGTSGTIPMIGGRMGIASPYNMLSQRKCGAHYIKFMMDGARARLKANRKKLHPTDNSDIDKVIKTLIGAEETLFKNIQMIQEYNTMLYLYGTDYGGSKGTLTLASLEKLIARYHKSRGQYYRQEDNIGTIMRNIERMYPGDVLDEGYEPMPIPHHV